ncbi:hypothetical protein [Bacillus mesophilum]|uniref:Uncharacterized protein n=1 Tax=Bacillus mesophilum TaxID=1071718 RepID=A0A7V7UX80_9BACI|nr:hypothetical protein [Bacillus mesophilum]KAB2335591.1 hypothetical protein F7732_03185 [Bacillus mesophilum]
MNIYKLRIIYIIPNVFCYLMVIGFSIFVFSNAKGIEELSRLSIWVIILLLLFFVSIYGSYRIWSWIKEGKM